MRRLVVGLAALVVAVPAANAAPDRRGADGADGAIGSAFVQGVTDFPGTSAIHDRPVAGSAFVQGVTDFPGTSAIHDRPVAGYPRALPTDYGVRPVQVVERPGGFDWGDALAGAGVAFGLVLLAAAAARATRHASRPAAA
ncbi:MAG: hypothetical protein ACRDNI_05300 [Gaiellaceae bacterium]